MKLNTHIGNVGIKFSDERLMKNLKNAQRELDEAVLNDTTPFVPKRNGFLRGSGRIADGGGEIIWDAGIANGKSYAHFAYVGFVRTDENGRVFVGKHEEKPILTNRPLNFSEGTAEWFERSKEQNLQKWIDTVKKEIDKP